jgi:hypothetical protein
MQDIEGRLSPPLFYFLTVGRTPLLPARAGRKHAHGTHSGSLVRCLTQAGKATERLCNHLFRQWIGSVLLDLVLNCNWEVSPIGMGLSK